VLLGSRDLIAQARRWRKALGGGMRQAGVLAAAGIYALEHHVEQLAQDHANAEFLAAGLRAMGLRVEPPQTNMLYVEIAAPLVANLKKTSRAAWHLGDDRAAHASGDAPGSAARQGRSDLAGIARIPRLAPLARAHLHRLYIGGGKFSPVFPRTSLTCLEPQALRRG